MNTGSALALITALLISLTFGSCSRYGNNWYQVKVMPEKYHGEFKVEKMSINDGPEQVNSGSTKDIVTFAIGSERVFPMMFPDAYWIALSIEVDKSNDSKLRILTHTANQPKGEAIYAYLTMLDPINLRIDLPSEKTSIYMIKIRELTDQFKDL